MDRLARVARCRSRPRSVAAARDRPRRADGAHRGRGRLDGDGAGPAAVGDLRRAQDRGRRHADAGPDRALPHVHAALLFPGCDRRVAPVPAYPAESGEPGVTLADLLAGVIFAALNAYAVLAGADFGGGVWALLARGPQKERQRDLIAHAIGPVWEANHVWLILAIVLVFTGFPRAFASLSTFLHVPLLLILIGIVMRGSAFVFRAYGPDDPPHERFWGRIFAMASITTPLFLGVIVGAI